VTLARYQGSPSGRAAEEQPDLPASATDSAAESRESEVKGSLPGSVIAKRTPRTVPRHRRAPKRTPRTVPRHRGAPKSIRLPGSARRRTAHRHRRSGPWALRMAARGVRWAFMSSASAHSGVLVMGLVLARWTSPVGLGEFGVGVVALILIRGTAGLGMGSVIAGWRGDPAEIAPTAMAISLGIGGAVSAAVYAAAHAFAAEMSAPGAAGMVRLLAPSALICGAAVVPRSMMRRRTPNFCAVIDQVGNWSCVAVTIGLTARGFGPASLAVGAMAGCLFSGGLFIVMAPKAARVSLNRRRTTELLRSLPLPATSKALMCVTAVADLVVVGHLLHARMLGLYLLALCCASWPIGVLSQQISDMTAVSLARFARSPKIAGSIFRSSARLLACVVMPTGILLASGSAGRLIHLLYGPLWAPVVGPLPWLVALAVFRVFCTVANEYITAMVSRRIPLALQLIWLGWLIPALIMAARLDDIVGVAICELAAAALMACACFVLALRPADARSGSRPSLLSVLLAAAVCLIAFQALRPIHDDYAVLAIGVTITLGVTSLLMYWMRTMLGAVQRVAVSVPAWPEAVGERADLADAQVMEPALHPVLSVVPSAPTARSPRPAADSLSSRIRRGARWSMLNAIVMRVSGSVITAYLARTVFDPEVWGLYAVSQVVLVVLLSSNELGVCSAIVRWDGDVRTVARTVLTLSVATSTAIYAALYVAAPDIARLLGSPGATDVVRVICICVIIDGFAGVPSALIAREFAQRRQMICDSFNFLVSTGVMLALAFTGHGAMSFAWGAVAGSTVATVMYNVFAPSLVLPGWNTGDARRLLRFGLPLAGAALLMLGVFNVDSAIVGSTLGPVMLGFYALAFNISNWPVTVIMQAAGRVSFAGFSRVAGSRQRLVDGFSRALAVAMALTVPACVLLGTLAAPLVHAVYGPRWAAAAPVLQLLAALGLLRVAYALIYDCLAAAGKRHMLMWIQAIWLGSLIPALEFGARSHGIVGVGAGHVVIAAGLVGPLFLWALARVGITVGHLARACLRPLAGGAMMAGVSLLVIHVAGSDLPGLAAAATAGLAVYAPVVFPMRGLLRGSPRKETNVDPSEVSAA
jgi:O-antigen/teichoic acid export membrane protein